MIIMKATPQELKIMKKMQPGVITLGGFLGSDRRNLADIIADDAKVLDAAGMTAAEVAERMQYYTERSWDNFGEPVVVDEHHLVSTDIVRGKLPCPFGHPGIYRKAVTYYTNTKLNISLRWTSLSIHLIKEHGFFEGQGSAFRLDPALLIKALF